MEITPRPFAVVTGGPRGIGPELAKKFSRNGFDMLLAAEPDERLGSAAAEVQALGAGVSMAAADLTKLAGVHTVHEAIKPIGRPVDAAAINAGVGAAGDFRETSLDKEISMIHLICIREIA